MFSDSVFANQDTPPDLMPDESTTWGARYNSLNSLAACPNSTSDFAMLAQCVSTPFTHKTPFNSNFFHDTGDNMRVCAHTHLHLRVIWFYSFLFLISETSGSSSDADNDAYIRRQQKKLR